MSSSSMSSISSMSSMDSVEPKDNCANGDAVCLVLCATDSMSSRRPYTEAAATGHEAMELQLHLVHLYVGQHSYCQALALTYLVHVYDELPGQLRDVLLASLLYRECSRRSFTVGMLTSASTNAEYTKHHI